MTAQQKESMMNMIANDSICPVCGERVRLVKIESDPEEGPGPGWISYQVVCENCGARGPYDAYGAFNDKKEYAISGWNKLIGMA